MAAALLLALAGCQPLPQPFADMRPAHNPLLDMPDSYGVTLSPIGGLDAASNNSVASLLVDRLLAANVPAMREGGTRASFQLAAAAAQAAPNARGIRATAVRWELVRDDKLLLQLERPLRFYQGNLLLDDEAIIQEVADAVARVMRVDSPAMRAGNGPPPALRLVVPKVAGAPGDGPDSLAAAMTGFLRSHGLRADPEGQAPDDALRLVGTVNMGRPERGQQRVEIVWTLVTPTGREIGTVRQSNPVPAGSLNGKWGEIAGYAAEAGADGVMALIDQAQKSSAAGP